ncbi:MAG: L-threonylcarbamoyladenylate synthase [Pseudomonadota bacterium]
MPGSLDFGLPDCQRDMTLVMRLMNTTYLTAEQLDRAGQMLAIGQLVAFPTETVYGLGANALDERAVARIFEAKGRPSDNPLIVHIGRLDQLNELVSHVPESAQSLIDRFWPGPLTLVFPKSPCIPDLVTAGMDTVAVRMPAHEWTKEILQHANKPIAAPSANRSGSPSSTTWQAVQQDLDGRIEGIVCGPPCSVGLESTVLDLTGNQPRILRPGSISHEQICTVHPGALPYSSKSTPTATELLNSPGLRHHHYKPRARVALVSQDQPWHPNPSEQCCRAWYIGISSPQKIDLFERTLVCESVEQYAYELFHYFRNADANEVSLICCEAVDQTGLGTALMDRIRRAAS